MLRPDLVLQTKLNPPARHPRLLARPALIDRLAEATDYRLTLLHAGTGYGKSTALAGLRDIDVPLVWFTLDRGDSDPQRFLLHLIAAFARQFPHLSGAPLTQLDELANAGGEPWLAVATTLINALTDTLDTPALLVFDDVHLVSDAGEVTAVIDHLLQYAPDPLHMVIATRHNFHTPALTRLRAHGRVLDISSEALAFSQTETEQLFRDTYDMALNPEDLAIVMAQTEGWPIALQMVWQGLRSAADQSTAERSVADVLGQSHSGSLDALFDYLAGDVLERQPAELAEFMRVTAALRELSPAACNAVTNRGDSDKTLHRLSDLSLFVVQLDSEHYRYQHLFNAFLRQQLAADNDAWDATHHRAATFFRTKQAYGESIYHWFKLGAFDEAADDIEIAGQPALNAGQLETVGYWIDTLPPETLTARPLLQCFQADIFRLQSRFDDALNWYDMAADTWRRFDDRPGLSRALRGKARVYLDTVRPTEAESLLEEALRLADGIDDRAAQARLLRLIAENKLNMGKPADAEALRQQALALQNDGPQEDALGVRVKLRTGQLVEAEHSLEALANAERSATQQGRPHPPRAHRETVLMLSLIKSFRGEASEALALANEGIAVGTQLRSPFVTAVGHMRLGHAWQLQCTDPLADDNCEPHAEAVRSYQDAIREGDRLAVRRTRAEAMWGLTRAYGYWGDLPAAERAASEAIEIGQWAGDPWIVALAELALGASYVLATRYGDGITVLSRSLRGFRGCSDPFGRAASRLWLSLAYLETNQDERLQPNLAELMALCETYDYGFLFQTPTMLGLPDPRRAIPLLISARNQDVHRSFAARILSDIGLPDIELHPGYQLRLKTFGHFRAWHSHQEIARSAWRRDKARQLLHLFITHREKMLDREQIVEMLWPDLDADTAQRDFKVALNTLYKVLEPNRKSGAQSAFIARRGTVYGLRAEADLWLDVAEFEQHIAGTDLSVRHHDGIIDDHALNTYQQALVLYDGPFLQEYPYDSWLSAERERLLALYLHTADKVAATLIEREQFEAALELSRTILAHDDCWERAYWNMMQAYWRLNNRPQALRMYRRCEQVLRKELDTVPSPYIVALNNRITASASPA